jgi:hypothetical protein
MALHDENHALIICGEHKEYVNFAHRILQSAEIKVK